MKTADTVTTLGLYSCDCCNKELIFDVGDSFNRCPKCEKLCNWELVEVVVPFDKFGHLDEEAA
jgi:hypothetical protein